MSAPLIALLMDAGDHRLVRQWVGEGCLPVIAGIIQRGCFRIVSGINLQTETGCWRSLLSGVSKIEHGYYSYRQLRVGTYNLVPTDENTGEERTTPFWYHLRGSNSRTVIFDPPEFSDVYPELNGAQVTNWAGLRTERYHPAPRSMPPQLVKEVEARWGRGQTFAPFIADERAREEKDYDDLVRALSAIERKGAACRNLLASSGCDLFLAGFFPTHPLGHRMSQYLKHPSSVRRLNQGLREIYSAIDRQFGMILADLPENANVFVVSAYGLEDMFPNEGLTQSFLHQLGYWTPASNSDGGSGSRSKNPLHLWRNAVPEKFKRILTDRMPMPLQESLLSSALARGTDWHRTKAFSIPHLYNGLIRVNLRGREPNGIVEGGREYSQLLDQIELDFRLLIDPATAQPAVLEIIRTVDTYKCGTDNDLPDIIVKWRPVPHFMPELLHPKTTLTQEKQFFHRPSYHSTEGFIAAAGPNILTDSIEREIDALDLAPTFLSLMNAVVPSTMKGKAIRELCKTGDSGMAAARCEAGSR